jgi:dihydroflavonol-4-reductase
VKTFITGGTGFIGTHLVRRMAQTEHEMVCLTRATSVGATVVRGDVTVKESMLKAMKGCDWVINLANIYTFWEPDKRVYTRVNVEGTRNVMECALETGVSKIVHASSMVTYGQPIDVPFTEESAVGPVRFSEYAESKYQADLATWDLHRTQGLPVLMVYPAGVLGPGDNKASGQYIQSLIGRERPATAFHDSVLTWVHAKDVAETIVRALEKEGNIGEKYLVGKELVSFQQLNEMVSEVSGVPLPGMRLPDSVAMAMATFATWFADLSKKPPINGMAADQYRTMKLGFRGDGSKAERELGISYTPIRVTIQEAIASYQDRA